MLPLNEAYLAHLKVICDHGSRPAVWDGMGKDTSVPEKVAKRLQSFGFIERQGRIWVPTRAGRMQVGRAV